MTNNNTKKMIYSSNQIRFIKKVDEASNYLIENNANIGEYFSAYNDLLKCDWFAKIQKPYLQKVFNRIYKLYGYVDKKLFAKVIYNTLENLNYLIHDRENRFIASEYKQLENIQKIAVAFEISKTFRKTRNAKK